MRLVYIQPVYAELFKGHNVVLAGGVMELLQLGFQIFLGTLQLLDGKALGAAGLEFCNAVLDLPYLLPARAVPAALWIRGCAQTGCGR